MKVLNNLLYYVLIGFTAALILDTIRLFFFGVGK